MQTVSSSQGFELASLCPFPVNHYTTASMPPSCVGYLVIYSINVWAVFVYLFILLFIFPFLYLAII